MKKYNIEGGIDFFSELYKSLDIEENEEKTEEDKNKCLITNHLLIDKFVSLNCGHKFNYIPLYNDIVNHKKKFNHMESNSGKLNTNEIRCPYCRKKHKELLPYYEDLGLEKINGVNFYDPNLKQPSNYNPYKTHKCEFQYPNPNYNSNEEESDVNAKYLNNLCGHYHGVQIKVFNKLNPSQPITYGDNKYYCYTHLKEMIKQYKLQQKDKEKLEKKQVKELEKQVKELEKQTKLLEKQYAKLKEKEEKKKAKEALKKNPNTENVVLGPSIIQTGCVQILKTGPNKGTICGCKITSENMCKRHFLLNHKELIVNN